MFHEDKTAYEQCRAAYYNEYINGITQGAYQAEITILTEKGFLAWLKYRTIPETVTCDEFIALDELAERETCTRSELVNLLATLIGNDLVEL